MSNSHELQVATLGMKVAEDLKEYVATDSKEAEQKLIAVLCSSPSLYEKIFNKRAYGLKQEIIQEELRVLRKHNANVMQLHFDIYYASFKESSDIYIRELRARGNAHLTSVFEELSTKVIEKSEQETALARRKFSAMMKDAEEVWSNRPEILEDELASIRRRMRTVMEGNEQALSNLLQLLRRDAGF